MQKISLIFEINGKILLMMLMKIYFAGAIRGGRDKVYDYAEIINCLEEYGEVLTKHIGDVNLTNAGEAIKDEEIYARDIEWLKQCDLVVADITIPSLGVGYELAYAEDLQEVLIFQDESYEIDKNISGLIKGNSNFLKIPYTDLNDLIIKIKEVMEELKIK